MEVREHVLPSSNQFISDYIENNLHIQSYFHYSPFDYSSYQERLNELNTYEFPRKGLADYLLDFNKGYQADSKTIQNIERLLDPSSTVVIGGQQAGILTGPIYTINKIITIIQQAREMEEHLNKPVLPVFWIAGEDHDFSEINHLYAEAKGQIKKVPLSQKWPIKQSISDGFIDIEACADWIEEIFFHFGETAFTKDVLKQIKYCLNESETYIDFFARLVLLLFKDTGLILIDSGSKELRKLETPYFQSMITHNVAIDLALNRQQELKKANGGYPKMIETEPGTAHLFYHVKGERILLGHKVRDGVSYFEGKGKECSFSETELLHLTEETPEHFSNNVVTRPLMQELLFPTLSFVAGPGEVSYWAELKGAFEVMGRKMPPVFPRLMATIINRSVKREIEELGLSTEEVLQVGVSHKRQSFLDELKDHSIANEIQKMKEALRTHYTFLEQSSLKIHDSMSQIVSKNELIIHGQLDFLEKEFYKQTKRKNEIILQKYNQIQNLLKPNDQPQERMLNIFYFVNLHGLDFVNQMLEQTSSSEFTHKVIYI
jgi:bacillithiol biosynthesis cysteine-adding enzyme BshC